MGKGLLANGKGNLPRDVIWQILIAGQIHFGFTKFQNLFKTRLVVFGHIIFADQFAGRP
jgi:hypothetical protein